MSSNPAFEPLKVGPLTLRNRFIKAATNEGMAKKGVVTKGLAKFHRDIAAGGAAMSVVAYCATSLDGRTFVDQATLNQESLKDFKVLTDGVHDEGAAACAQITHAGCFTFLPRGELTTKPMSASGGFNKAGVMTGRFTKQKMSRDDMDQVANEFVEAAKNARECGFDAVEIHMGHGYLLSQFVSKFYNKRWDKYGGKIENRMRFPQEVLSKVLDAVGKDLAVTVKYSMTDGRSGGNTIEDGVKVAKILEETGAHMVVLSNGMNIESISAMFGSSLPAEVSQPPKNPIIRLGMQWQKISEFKRVEFKELYSMERAKKIRQAVSMPLCYLGGAQTKDNIDEVMAEGFEAIAMGRALIYDPAYVKRLHNGSVTESGCTACNQCVTLMYTPGGTGCVLKELPDGELNKHAASA